MTPERKEQLLALRQEREQRDQQRTTEGRLLDGVAIIEKSFAALPAVSTPLMEEAIALRGKGKGKAKLKR
jgi:hypothetical protein